MLDLGEEQDNLTMKRYRDMESRLVEVRGTDRVQLTSKDDQLNRFLSDKPGSSNTPTASSGAANPRRGQGGRSSDYR